MTENPSFFSDFSSRISPMDFLKILPDQKVSSIDNILYESL